MSRLPLAALIAPVLALAALLPGCGPPPVEHFVGAPVVLISIDTLRADRLPIYGFAGVETPAIDALAAEGIVYERAWSHYPLTLPSHATMLTGVLSPVHGVRDNVGYRLEAAAHSYLPRTLAENGYVTGASVSTYLLRRDTGLGASFDFYDDAIGMDRGTSLAESQRSGRDTVDRAIEWLREVAGSPRGEESPPFFLFLHLYEPHTPYEPPAPFAGRYEHPYLGEIAAADALVGELIAELRRLGVYDDSLVILLSDHGEGLGDHGEREHGILLYREDLQVPLVMKLPGARHEGTRVAAAAGLADVAPTIARLVTDEDWPGATSLLDLLGPRPPQRPIYAETFYPRLHLGWSDLAAAIDGDEYYIDGPDPELYDLATDPDQRRNILAEDRRAYRRLRDLVEEHRRPLEAPGAVDPETAGRLASLGYLATTAVAEGPLPDPKASLHILDDLMAGVRFLGAEDWASCTAALQRVVAENPGLVDAWENLAQCQQNLGRYGAAEASFRRALELSGGADHVALGAARLFLELERWDDARRHAELALESNPAAAYRLLGRVAFATGELDSAVEHAQAALAARPGDLSSQILLAEVATLRNRPDEALTFLAAADQELARRTGEEAPPGLDLVRGDALARLGRSAEARAAFEDEIERHPRDPRAWGRLAVLHAVEGRSPQAVAVLRQLVESQQTSAAYATAVDTLRVLGDPRSAGGLLRQALGRFPDDPALRKLEGELAVPEAPS